MTRLRRGESDAAWKLIELYEPQIRRAVRVRIQDVQLRKVIDSLDICQTVFANFFVRAASGEYELDHPKELIALLVTMARNRVNDWYRKEKGRDGKRPPTLEMTEDQPLADQHAAHTKQVEASDLLTHVRRQLTAEERRIIDLRSAGKSWIQIADSEDISADGARMRLRRALDRIIQNLGLEDEFHALH